MRATGSRTAVAGVARFYMRFSRQAAGTNSTSMCSNMRAFPACSAPLLGVMERRDVRFDDGHLRPASFQVEKFCVPSSRFSRYLSISGLAPHMDSIK